MYNKKSHPFAGILVLVLAMLACSVFTPSPTATPVPTNTPIPSNTPLPTATLVPTDTPVPSATPNVVATQQAGKMQAMLAELLQLGYVDTTEGTFTQLEDFSMSWTDVSHYNWWPVIDKPIGNFVLSGHYKWSTATTNNYIAGCGVIFGLQDNDDFYGVFVDKARIQFTLRRGTYMYDVGVTKGSGRLNFGNPAETDMVLVVKGQKAYINIDGRYITYTLSADQTTSGRFAYTMLTNTDQDYGTRCEMTNMVLWQPK